MIDVHCHILPGVDDGADTLQTSLMMAAMAADDGVTAIVATPHFMKGGPDARERYLALRQETKRLRAELKREHLPIKLFAGAEVLCKEDTLTLLEDSFFPCLHDTDYALVEFFFDQPREMMEKSLEKIWYAGITPVIAHPERYDAVQKKHEVLADWAQRGYYIQLNKGSLQGSFGKEAQRTAEWTMKRRLAALLGTDAHGTEGRTTRLKELRKELEEKFGESYLKLLTEVNPVRLLRNEELKTLYR